VSGWEHRRGSVGQDKTRGCVLDGRPEGPENAGRGSLGANKTAGDGFFIRARRGLCETCHVELCPKAAIAAWVMVIVIAALLVIGVIAAALKQYQGKQGSQGAIR
jgi:hypothetical protein